MKRRDLIIQIGTVHLIRNSLNFVGWEERKRVAAELKNIYRATTTEEALQALPSFGSGHFPNDEAAAKLIWLALRNIERNWKMPAITWRTAKNQFAILFAERFTAQLWRGVKINA